MLGIISDIHGNYPALQAVLEQLDKRGCDEIISLGDVCGYYCMINECIEELREREIVNILGNHDSYIVRGTKCGRSYTANLCLDYQRSVLKDENSKWIQQSVEYIKRDRMWLVHGGWNNYLDEYISDYSFIDSISEQIDIFVSGHTHVQKRVNGMRRVYINPGSVGQPRDYNPEAAYAIIHDDGTIELKRTEYDIDRIVRAMDNAGFPKRVSSCLYRGTKIGEDKK